MAGIYIHIPYCKQACHYCNFHFSTSLKSKVGLIEALIKEMKMRKSFLEDESVESIYFGGGTPSLLEQEELETIIDHVFLLFKVSDTAEITLEANPDDLSRDKIKILKSLKVNRLSIGLQSFDERDLSWMNRAHTSSESVQSVKMAQDLGFDNISIDLIFGSAVTDQEVWKSNLEKAVDLEVSHISSYGLTVEPHTALDKMIKLKKSPNIDEEKQAEEFVTGMKYLQDHGYEHYEISNFAKDQKYAVHNTNYWFGKKYLGLGPSAHSFDGKHRYWNVRHNLKYIENLNKNSLPITQETISNYDRYNEYILTRLRTQWGCNLNDLNKMGSEIENYFLKNVATQIKSNHVQLIKDNYTLTEKGKLLADGIASDLFFVI